MVRAVFFDRDGTLNDDCGYTHSLSDLKPVPGADTLFQYVLEKGFLPVIVSNQSGIGRGYYTEDDFFIFTRALIKTLTGPGTAAKIPIYHCPHLPESCLCRKPSPEMILRACRELDINPNESYFVGNSISDAEAAAMSNLCRIMILENDGVNQAELERLGAEGFASLSGILDSMRKDLD